MYVSFAFIPSTFIQTTSPSFNKIKTSPLSTPYTFKCPLIRPRTTTSSTRPFQTVAAAYPMKDRNGLTVLHVPGISRQSFPIWQLGLLAFVLFWLWRQITMRRHLKRLYQRRNLSSDIATFYDQRSAAWETVWGEHMHHGLYDVVDGKMLKGRRAQIRTMSELLNLGDLMEPDLKPDAKILDVGCGIGGASRFLARHFGPECQVTGITLSLFQAQRANEINKQQGLSHRVKNEVRNALDTGFPDDHFDVVWSLESGEHMEDKQLFLKECSRVLKPGGKLLMLAWCIRETTTPLKLAERFSIRRVMEEYCLPRVAPPSEYSTEMVRSGLRGVTVSDWTKRAIPFWGEVVRSAIFNPKGWLVLLKNGWPLIRSALAMRHMIAALRQGSIRLVAFSGRKQTAKEAEEEAQRAVQCCSKSSLPVKV